VRIAYVAGAALPSPKASTIQVMMMCQAMARLGHEVTLYTPSHRSSDVETARRAVSTRQAPVEDLWAYYGVERNFRIVHVPLGPWWEGNYRGIHFQYSSVKSARLGRGGLYYARGRGWPAASVALGMGANVVYEAHGLPASPREAYAVRRLSYSRQALLVFISEALRQRYSELGIPGRRSQLATRHSLFVVAPDGVDLHRFTPPLERGEARQLCGLPLDRKLVVYAGGLYAGRGVDALVEALAGVEAVLVIVGGGDEAQINLVRERASACGTQVMFLGHRPPAEVPRYLFAADVLAMPYAATLATATGEDTAAWMSPLKMFEYMAAGRPIVATDLPALREVLRHESNALLSRPGSVESLRDQIARLLSDDSLAVRLAGQARQDVAQYTWEKRAERILEGMGSGRA
jgi:glycosyltransferase involved in cell wall biosynthesis